jgi:hypothetical protein
MQDSQMPGDVAIGLRWAIKRSFVAYISKAPGGRATVRDGAFATADGEVVFPFDHAEVDPPARSLFFSGGVVFSAHSGLLHIPLDSPRIDLNADEGALTVVDPFDQSGEARRLVATFEFSHERIGPFEHWRGTSVQLASESTELFNGVYPVAEQLDRLSVVLPA